ncbi:hypothetical protein BDR04DRAFT_1229997 [Suillus decipiens]|nr:hypothetical protein BDR04DRAFT_1229997 [Suillus decipiens]
MTVHHVVLYTFKPEVTPEQRQNMRDYGRALPSQISAIQSLLSGKPVFNPLTHGYEEGVIFVLESVAKLNEYHSHKAHLDFQALAKPLTESMSHVYLKINLIK